MTRKHLVDRRRKMFFISHCIIFVFLFRSNCDDKIGAILREHYQRPYFLPPNSESEKTDWIFMGSHGYGAPMHVSRDSCFSRY